MSSNIIKGKVRFVNHEKQYVEIEYTPAGGGKVKTINGNIDNKTQQKLKEAGIIKKIHHFHIGDTVNFISKLSDRGDKMIAANIQYLFNEALDTLLNKAKTKNEFTGYIKQVDDKFFIKEIDSYLFFPLEVSPWQMKFTEREMTEGVPFQIEHIEKKEKATAKLLRNNYIPEFYKMEKLYKEKTTLQSTVYLVNEFGVYVHLLKDTISAKIPLTKLHAGSESIKVGDTIEVQITHLTPLKIVVEKAAQT